MTNNKIVSPQAIVALEKALSVIYWYKRDLKSFLYQIIGEDSTILAVINWSDLKKDIAARVINMLVRNGDRTRHILMQLIIAVSDFADSSHLEILEGGKEKAKHARDAVMALRLHVSGYQNLQQELEKAKLRREQNKKSQDEINRSKQSLAKLKEEFFTWSVSSDRQGSGMH